MKIKLNSPTANQFVESVSIKDSFLVRETAPPPTHHGRRDQWDFKMSLFSKHMYYSTSISYNFVSEDLRNSRE